MTEKKWIDVRRSLPRAEAEKHLENYRETLTVVVCRTKPPILLPHACVYDPIDEVFYDYDGEVLQPTHWMPLPYMPGEPCFFICGETGLECRMCKPGSCGYRRRV